MIDYKFIEQFEGNTCEGYVPDLKGSNSGVTIACGFDLGQRSNDEIKRLLSTKLYEKLSPYIGLKGAKAAKALIDNELIITTDECFEINEQVKSEAEVKLLAYWRKSKAKIEFSNLSSACQTVIASVAYQYGNLSTRTPIFWDQVTSGNWQGAINNLKEFGDRYSTRRMKEAELLEAWLSLPKV